MPLGSLPREKAADTFGLHSLIETRRVREHSPTRQSIALTHALLSGAWENLQNRMMSPSSPAVNLSLIMAPGQPNGGDSENGLTIR